jgi:ribosomal protein S6E (S10)
VVGMTTQASTIKHSILMNGRGHLLLSEGHSRCGPRDGRKYKSLCGCLVNANLSILKLVIVKTNGYPQTDRCYCDSTV